MKHNWQKILRFKRNTRRYERSSETFPAAIQFVKHGPIEKHHHHHHQSVSSSNNAENFINSENSPHFIRFIYTIQF